MRQTRTAPAPLRTRLGLDRLEDRTTPATLPTGFTEAAVATGLASATAMEAAPNGDLWVLEQGGGVKRFRTGSLMSWVGSQMNQSCAFMSFTISA